MAQSLQPGDRVAVVAPSGRVTLAELEAGVAILATRYRVECFPHVGDEFRYLAGSDEVRHADMQRALADSEFKAVFSARGGYGATRILDQLRFQAPKPLVGYSDFTAIHAAALLAGYRTLHAPLVRQLGNPEATARVFDALEGRALSPLQATRTILAGQCEGRLVGGNFRVLCSLIGTRSFPPLAGAVLLLEDVDEEPYRLDRMWTQLRAARVMDGLVGVVLGDFIRCEAEGAAYSSAEVLDDLVREAGVPAAAGFPIGHGALNLAVPLGARVRLDATLRVLEFPEGLFA